MAKEFILWILACILIGCFDQRSHSKLPEETCCENIYFFEIEKSIQPTFRFIQLTRQLSEIGFVPKDTIYRFKKEELNPPKNADTIKWNEKPYITAAWSIEMLSPDDSSDDTDVILTEYRLSDEVLNEVKSTIPVAIFGTFLPTSAFDMWDSSVVYINVINPDIISAQRQINHFFFRKIHGRQ